MLDFETRVRQAKREIRARSLDGIERRTSPARWKPARTDGGVADRRDGIVYNSWSEDLGGFKERIDPGRRG
jgi:hypothetical protein